LTWLKLHTQKSHFRTKMPEAVRCNLVGYKASKS